MDALRSSPRRNKGFDETHREMIATAVRLTAQSGSEGLTIAALARAMGINRTTVYYHFEHRDALLAAVKHWASAELARGMDVGTSAPERIGHISHFVLENPELIKLWIDDFVSGKDIRDSYPRWDDLVAGLAASFAAKGFYAMAALMLVSSTVGVTKTLRDNEEARGERAHRRSAARPDSPGNRPTQIVCCQPNRRRISQVCQQKRSGAVGRLGRHG